MKHIHVTLRKNKLIYLGLILLLAGIFLITPRDTQAASKTLDILDSYKKNSCQVDLDGDGTKEKLKLKISRNNFDITKIVLQVNGYNSLTLRHSAILNSYTAYIEYINMSRQNIFIRVTVSGDNDYLSVDNVYRYNPATRKMVKAARLLDARGWSASGAITSVTPSSIKISYRYQFPEIGSVKWTNTYIVKNKKLILKPNYANVASVYTTDYDPDGYSSLFIKNKFKTKKSIKLYTDTSLKQVSYTAKKNKILTLKKIKYANGNFYVQFSNGAKNGWLKLKPANYNPVFYGVENRLAG